MSDAGLVKAAGSVAESAARIQAQRDLYKQQRNELLDAIENLWPKKAGIRTSPQFAPLYALADSITQDKQEGS